MHDYKIYNTLFARASTVIFVSLKLYYSLIYWKEWGIVLTHSTYSLHPYSLPIFWKEGNFECSFYF